MKKQYVNFVSILLVTLCLAFTACNQGMLAGGETGTVQVVIGGGAARSVDAAGLPVFDDTNTKITVTGKDGTQLAEGTTSVMLKLDIGTKITVKAVVTTAAGVWRGSTEHTVTAGTNTVSVKLSKTPKNMRNILSSVISQSSFGDAKVTFKLASGKELLNDVDIGSNHIIPVIARDGIGRIYVLYDKGGRHFTRFDAEGNEDTGFEAAIKGILQGFDIGRIKTMTVDAKTGTIFIVGMDSTGSKHAHAVTEKGHNNFTLSNGFGLASIGIDNTIQAAAAYNGTLFFTVSASTSGATMGKNKLVAVKAELSGSTLTLTHKATQELSKLRTDSAFGNSLTKCTGLFADESGVYCLLSDQNLYGGNLYALGQIVRYQYSGSAFTGETKIGLNPKAAGTDGIPFDAQYFSAPVGFIGYDEENIYIADDGVNIEYLNENYHINGNKNRIAAFNRKTNEITFEGTAATWYAEKPEHKLPSTKMLLWEKGDNSTYFGMKYWLSDNGNDSCPADADADALFASNNLDKLPSDVFCYDQDGNLYILWKDGSDYKVRRFALQDDGTYDKSTAQDLKFQAGVSASAIAVDVSDENHYLYYANGTINEIKRYWWSSTFGSAVIQSYSITLPSGEKVTALAANKDGVFVATKEQSTAGVPYTLKIKKYKKDGSPNGEKTIAYNEGGDTPTSHPSIDYTNSNGTVCGLQVIDGVLYALRHNIEEKIIYVMGNHRSDEFRSSGVIYKVGNTDGSLSDTAMSELGKKEADDASRTGYGFYRFIAVKPKKLVIASDGAWGTVGTALTESEANYRDTDKVLEYDLAGQLKEENAGGGFSKKLNKAVCEFKWN